MLTENLNKTKVAVDVSDVKPGDTVYISNSDKSVPYYVVDVGVPFLMLENTHTHFACAYRVVKPIYKEQ